MKCINCYKYPFCEESNGPQFTCNMVRSKRIELDKLEGDKMLQAKSSNETKIKEEDSKNYELEYCKYLNFLVAIRNTISLICFTILAIIFHKWWIVFFAIFFWSFVKEEDK